MRHVRSLWSVLLAATWVLATGLAYAAPQPDAKKSAPKTTEAAAKAVEPSATVPTTYTVKKAPLKIVVSLDGCFEARDTVEVEVRTNAWSDLEVVKAVEHGAQVKRGDPLVTLDMEEVDKAIATARNEKQLADVTVKLAEADLKQLEAGIPLDQLAADRAHKRNSEDFARYYKVELPLTLKAAELSLQLNKEFLENQKEELRQLEKMYKADDLTEETEEIILKRQRSAVKRAEFVFDRAKLQHEETLRITLPRTDEDKKRAAQAENIQYDRLKAVIPLVLSKAQNELEKARLLQAKSQEKLDELVADRERMIVEASTDGIVYYGRSVDGKFTGSTGRTLKRGDKITAKQVFMTIVKTRPMTIRVDVPEDKLHAVSTGLKGTACPKAFPELKAPATVAQVAAIPSGEGKFKARIDVTLAKDAAAVMPGMVCTVKLVTYLNKDAMTVPKTALQADPLDDLKQYVYVVGKDGKPKKQPVTVGKKTDKVAEILQGISVGDKVRTTPPK